MWKTRRRIAALLVGAAALLLPFLRIRGRSAARFDLPTLSLHFFGAVVPIDEFYLVLLGALFLVSLTLWVTIVFGRLWCGWLCPQTVIGEIGEWIASALPPGFRSGGKALVLLRFTAVVLTVQGVDGTPGEIEIIAAGRGFRIGRKAAFP